MTCFYFEEDSFWKEQREVIAQFAVQVNFEQEFKIEQILGQGTFSKVFKAEEKRTKNTVAIKVLSKDKSTSKVIIDEKNILRLLGDKDCAPRFLAMYEDESKYILVMEYVPGVDMMTFIKLGLQLSEEQQKQLLRDVLHCILTCHQMKVWHRDIKPHNIILDIDQKPKLIDFGLATQPQNCLQQNSTKCGTIGYMAP